MKAIGLKSQYFLLVFLAVALNAQSVRPRDPVQLRYWPAPLYWQSGTAPAGRAANVVADAVNFPSGANPLVFVAMTPCRVVDTRASQGFPGAFGAPSLVGGASRTFPMQTSTTCSIPAAAQAYSLNITVVPPGPLGFLTAYPTGQPLPLAATVNSPQGFIVGNAAIVPGGTNGSIDLFASNATDVVIDINGYYAALYATSNNTGLGFGALANNTTGDFNTAAGSDALRTNSTGSYNTATGSSALPVNTGGSFNTASGALAMQFNTTGSSNTGLGYGALDLNSNGGNNTAVGYNALSNNTTGGNNIAVGSTAAANVGSGGSNNIDIGSPGTSSDTGAIRIGNPGNQVAFFAAGVRGVTTGSNNAVPVLIDSNGQLGTVSSSERFKEDIRDMGNISDGLMQLRPVVFRYKQPFADGSKPIQFGLIAEEVFKIYPELVARSSDGEIETVKYQVLDSLLLNEVQRQQKQIEDQRDQIRTLQERLEKLEETAPAPPPLP
jgi:hypothetical protein